ncbi:MAG: CehA/McbA family metallohydrolase, partial [Myxococcales bacterium]|nr:CehA/McbA family metallohydrolase [Myxococcales bacterium]
RLGGRVIDSVTGAPATDASVVVYQVTEDGEYFPYSQYDVHEGGNFGGTLVPGRYSLRVTGPGRAPTDHLEFFVTPGVTTGIEVTANSPGRIAVAVFDSRGQHLPARATAVGTYDAEFAGMETRHFLFDLQVGEDYRISDMVPDLASDPSSLRYIEAQEPTVDGRAELIVRPGRYEVYTSRGPEYDLQSTVVDVAPGQSVSVVSRLERVVDTSGWIAGDMHIHATNSIDSKISNERQVLRLAAEGIEWAVSTDHNFITDYSPTIRALELQDWMTSAIGLELTTLDGGHFNGYPLSYQVGPLRHGSFDWSLRPPGEIFAELRALGRYGPDDTIVQVNHPRDTILGYFNQHRRDGLTTEFNEPGLLDQFIAESGPAFYDEDGEPTFSLEFDALEIVNGNRFDILRHYRVPERLPEGEIPDDLPPAGTLLLDSDGEVAYPGAVDDWFNFLNLGERFIGTGASDTHGDSTPAGYARSMIYVGDDDPRGLSNLDIVHAMQSRRVVATNGPLLDFYVNDPADGAMGSTLIDGDGEVQLTYILQAAPWVSVARVNIIRNGIVVYAMDVDPNRDLAADPLTETVTLQMELDDDTMAVRDSWFVMEAVGYRSMFPVVWPYEVPSILVEEAIGSLAEPAGFGNEFGAVRPSTAFPVAAYAITNPVWVTTDGGEFDPPGVVPRRVVTAPENDSGVDQNPFGYNFLMGPEINVEGAVESPRVRDVGTATPINPPEDTLFLRRVPTVPYDVRHIFGTYGHHHNH